MSGNFCGYSEYLDSGVKWIGSVPAHWTPLRFKRVLSEKRHTPNPDLPAGSISFGRVVYKNSETLAEATKASYQEVLPDEFLVNPLNLNFDLKSLRTALSDIAVVVSTGYIVLRSGSSRLDRRYTRWLLQEFDVAHMKTLGAGVRQTINFTDIGNSLFFAPSIEEQATIAKFLDYETAKIDALIEKQQQLIALLKEKRQAVISHAVTKGLNPDAPMRDSGVEWLGEVPAHWKVARINKFANKITNGYVGPTRGLFMDSGVRYLQSLHIKNNRVVFTPQYYVTSEWSASKQKSILRAGDVLIVQTGDIGQSACVPAEFAGANCHALIVVATDQSIMSGPYLSWCLNSDYGCHSLKSIQTGALHPHLNCGTVKYLPIPVPPMAEQDRIVERVEVERARYDNLQSAGEKQIHLLQERRSALISAAVTGKIDVRSWQAPAAELEEVVA